MDEVDRAKTLYFGYRGSHFQMARDGVLEEYRAFAVPKARERVWIGQFGSTFSRGWQPQPKSRLSKTAWPSMRVHTLRTRTPTPCSISLGLSKPDPEAKIR